MHDHGRVHTCMIQVLVYKYKYWYSNTIIINWFTCACAQRKVGWNPEPTDRPLPPFRFRRVRILCFFFYPRERCVLVQLSSLLTAACSLLVPAALTNQEAMKGETPRPQQICNFCFITHIFATVCIAPQTGRTVVRVFRRSVGAGGVGSTAEIGTVNEES